MSETLTTGLLSVELDGFLRAVRARDGGWIVTVPPSGATIVACRSSAGACRASLNVRGPNLLSPPATLRLPAAVVPGDALVLLAAGSGRGDYWPVDGRSSNVEAMPVVFVEYAAAPGYLRPPAIGDGSLVRLLRRTAVAESDVRLGRLPRVVDAAACTVGGWGGETPTIPYLTALLGGFCGELWDSWATDTRTPDRQHPGYGSYLASVVSQALVQLCSTASDEQKLPLALAVVQWGLDLAGAFADGRRHVLGGGHCAGRKALVVMAGHLLGVEALAHPSAIVGPVFQEDLAYVAGDWWFGGDWNARWRFQLGGVGDASLCAQPPATWGAVVAPAHNTWAWAINGYMPQVVGAQVGTALAMRLMHREAAIGPAFVRMVEQWMQGPPAAARTELVAEGIALPWGTDYSVVRGAGFCAAAWRRYAHAATAA